MKVSIIIVNYNVRHFLQVCLDAVSRAPKSMEAEIIVVDNHSADDSIEMVRSIFPEVILLENETNLGFSKANNQGVAIAKGDYILFLNPDTVMPEDFFSEMIPYMDAHPEAGAIGPRLIDGKGAYAPDGKKGFPTLSVALYKTTGINKIFPRSAFFNRYYAMHIGEHETAAVDVLSGCCMMVRRSVITELGGAFDEAFFMYCEDVDLCFRIQQAGYQNIYFPAATLIHYKGESTRKNSFAYVRIFNDALATFVRKHYGQKRARVFLFFINAGIALRAILGVVKTVFNLLRMPLLDALLLFLVLWLMKGFWVEQVKDMQPIPVRSVLLMFPVYAAIWIGSLFLNGAYDKPYRGLRVLRGMGIGTILVLAFYGLLPPEMRYSRAMLLFSGAGGAIALIAFHELLLRFGIVKLQPENSLAHKAVIVADAATFETTNTLLKQVHYAPKIMGRVSPDLNDATDALGNVMDLKPLLRAAEVEEVLFCVNGLSFKTILSLMQECGNAFEYKIHLQGSHAFVGSNADFSAGNLYAANAYFSIANFAQQRNKRMIDLVFATSFLLLSPVIIWWISEKKGFFQNALSVIAGSTTWVGYPRKTALQMQLPKLRKAVLPPWNLDADYQPSVAAKEEMSLDYARDYHPTRDVGFILKNMHFLGKKTRKYFAERED